MSERDMVELALRHPVITMGCTTDEKGEHYHARVETPSWAVRAYRRMPDPDVGLYLHMQCGGREASLASGYVELHATDATGLGALYEAVMPRLAAWACAPPTPLDVVLAIAVATAAIDRELKKREAV